MRTRTAGLWILGLLLVLGATALSARQADARAQRFVRVKVDVANLRAQPVGTAKLVRHAYENEPLRVVGAQGQWIQVRDFTDESAWIHGALIDGRPAVVVVRDLVNVRQQPGTGHPVVFTAEQGVNLLLLERSGRWLHVRHEVGEGWLHDSLVWGHP
jgi:SH3-like domain-containing protein